MGEVGGGSCHYYIAYKISGHPPSPIRGEGEGEIAQPSNFFVCDIMNSKEYNSKNLRYLTVEHMTEVDSLNGFFFQLGVNTDVNFEDGVYHVSLINVNHLHKDVDYRSLENCIVNNISEIFNIYSLRNYEDNKRFQKLSKEHLNIVCFLFRKHDEMFLGIASKDATEIKKLIAYFRYLRTHPVLKYKATFTKSERSLIYKIKNGLCKERYGYNFDYIEDIRNKIDSLSSELQDMEEERLTNMREHKALLEMLRTAYISHETKAVQRIEKALKFNNESQTFIESEMHSISVEIKALRESYDSLTYSCKEQSTTVEDYLQQDTYSL